MRIHYHIYTDKSVVVNSLLHCFSETVGQHFLRDGLLGAYVPHIGSAYKLQYHAQYVRV